MFNLLRYLKIRRQLRRADYIHNTHPVFWVRRYMHLRAALGSQVFEMLTMVCFIVAVSSLILFGLTFTHQHLSASVLAFRLLSIIIVVGTVGVNIGCWVFIPWRVDSSVRSDVLKVYQELQDLDAQNGELSVSEERAKG